MVIFKYRLKKNLESVAILMFVAYITIKELVDASKYS